VRQCIHLTLLVGERYHNTFACASPFSVQPAIQKIISSLRIRSLQEKGLVEDLPPTQPQPEPGSRIVGLVSSSSSSKPTINSNSSAKTRYLGQPTSQSQHQDPARSMYATSIQNLVGGFMYPYSGLAPCKCLHPMSMSLCLIELRSRWLLRQIQRIARRPTAQPHNRCCGMCWQTLCCAGTCWHWQSVHGLLLLVPGNAAAIVKIFAFALFLLLLLSLAVVRRLSLDCCLVFNTARIAGSGDAARIHAH
jgi:hypothetical protein